MLNVNDKMGIDMLGSGQLDAVSVCVYSGAVCYWQTTTLHQRKVGGRCWLGKHNTGQGIGWSTTASWAELHS